MIYIGIDGGGSGCRALGSDGSGRAAFSAESGPVNWASMPLESCERHLRDLLSDAPEDNTVVGCFAGLIDTGTRDAAEHCLRSILGHDRVRCYPDYRAPLALCDQGDVVVLCGTGSVIVSMDMEGVLKTGGGGPLLGDFGSAYRFGMIAVRALIGLDVEHEPSTRLLNWSARELGTTEASEIVRQIYEANYPASRIARFAPIVAQDYASGEAYAQRLDLEMDLLTRLVEKHLAIRRTKRATGTIQLTGGLWKASGLYVEKFKEAMLSISGTSRMPVHRLQAAPVEGAVRLATTNDEHRI